MQSLESLIADGVVDEVIGQLKTGKEAEVWLVRHQEQVLAAKLYKERHERNFRNNVEYKEGRQVRNTRTQRAMDKGSRFGQQAAEDAWKSAEADAMHTLHAAGVRVPRPVMFYEGVLLMEVVIDAEGRVAPRLVDAGVTRESAAQLYEIVRANVVKMLCADLIHGDLSEFNVLLAWDGPVIIDFPQVVAAAKNSRAEHFFRRDLENVRRFFGNFDPAIAARQSDAEEIWRAYVRRELSPGFVPTGRGPVQRREFNPREQRRENRPPQQPQRGSQQRGGQQQQPAGRGPRAGGPQQGEQRPGQQRPGTPPHRGGPRSDSNLSQNQNRQGATSSAPQQPQRPARRDERRAPEVVVVKRPGGGDQRPPQGGHRRRRKRHF